MPQNRPSPSGGLAACRLQVEPLRVSVFVSHAGFPSSKLFAPRQMLYSQANLVGKRFPGTVIVIVNEGLLC